MILWFIKKNYLKVWCHKLVMTLFKKPLKQKILFFVCCMSKVSNVWDPKTLQNKLDPVHCHYKTIKTLSSFDKPDAGGNK